MKIYIDKNGKEYFTRICPYCKRAVTLYRNNNIDLLFDNNVYHKNCFISMKKQVHKKCKFCGKICSFNSLDSINMYYYQNKFYCNECFNELCQIGIAKKSVKWKRAEENKDKYLHDATEAIGLLLEKKKYTDKSIFNMTVDLQKYISTVYAEYDLNAFIKDMYQLRDVNLFYIRYLKPLYQGTFYKTPDVIIPPEHLLEMWKTQKKYLIKRFQKNISDGKVFSEQQRAAYDLIILINKYNDFLEWKSRQKLLEQENDNINVEIKEQSIMPISIKVPQTNHKHCEDVSDILKDIF